ncbi:MAG: peptidyl-prolyl cis-trans isomerase [Candidatus Aegiribacteria sp.]|nr:peptidyl-prolyl cis-trans isomerase [Candidatus Aegiribacteria sp.]
MASISSAGVVEVNNSMENQQIAASVDSSVIYMEDMTIAGITPSLLEEWIEDELLAELAAELGYENVRKSKLLQDRARQVYLRDELLAYTYARIPFPDNTEVFQYMSSDSLAFMVERHYYQIIVANKSMADSIHQKLLWGENFQITAERLSIGQKAGIGGDLGFLTAGELIAYGVPVEQSVIEGLGDVISTNYGWHIFLVDEIRQLEDTSRVVRSLADDIYRQRLATARDSLLVMASAEKDIFLDSTLVYDTWQYSDQSTDGSEAE